MVSAKMSPSRTALGDPKDREKAMEQALAQVEKQFGKGAIMRMGDMPLADIDYVPTGALPLDIALGIGGLPRGRIVEIFGPEASGKTTLLYHVMAQAQKRGGLAAFIDAEHSLDPQYARRIGVNTDELLVSQPDHGEQALEIADLLVRSGSLDVVAIDSVAALVPKAEIEGEMGDSFVGLQARLMSQALRKLTGVLNRTGTVAIFTNQLREKIGVMFGNPETTTGGKALKFYASLRLDIRRIGPVKDKEDVVGSHVRVKVVKNKVAPPFRQAEFDIMYAEGISHVSLLVDIGADAGIIEKSGAWYSYGSQRIGQGRENAKLFLKDNPAVMAEIEEKVKAVLGINKQAVAEDAEETVDDLLDAIEAGDLAPTEAAETAPDGVLQELFAIGDRLARDGTASAARTQLFDLLPTLSPEAAPFGVALGVWRRVLERATDVRAAFTSADFEPARVSSAAEDLRDVCRPWL